MSSIESLIRFLDNSPSPFHAVHTLRQSLVESGFQPLPESSSLSCEGNYYMKRYGASLIALRMPVKITDKTRFLIFGTHTDSPCLKIKPVTTFGKNGLQHISAEPFGGMLWNSWLNRDLGIAGIAVEKNNDGKPSAALVNLPWKLTIPQLAIHLDRDVNTRGLQLMSQQHLQPVLSMSETDLYAAIRDHHQLNNNILSHDLCLYDHQGAALGGAAGEFLYSARLDNLVSVWSVHEALISTPRHEHDIIVAAHFHQEEIGSETYSGARSNLLSILTAQVGESLGWSHLKQQQVLNKSLMISADMAHAWHPSYPDKHDPNHRPLLNHGPVLKVNSNYRYATDAVTMAAFKIYCEDSGTPYQYFSANSDIGCGSTIGPACASALGIPSLDVGCPMYSMHSAREMCGSEDPLYSVQLFSYMMKQGVI